MASPLAMVSNQRKPKLLDQALRLFEISRLLVCLNPVARVIVNANQSILPRARVDFMAIALGFPWRLCYCSRPRASILIGFAKA